MTGHSGCESQASWQDGQGAAAASKKRFRDTMASWDLCPCSTIPISVTSTAAATGTTFGSMARSVWSIDEPRASICGGGSALRSSFITRVWRAEPIEPLARQQTWRRRNSSLYASAALPPMSAAAGSPSMVSDWRAAKEARSPRTISRMAPDVTWNGVIGSITSAEAK